MFGRSCGRAWEFSVSLFFVFFFFFWGGGVLFRRGGLGFRGVWGFRLGGLGFLVQ